MLDKSQKRKKIIFLCGAIFIIIAGIFVAKKFFFQQEITLKTEQKTGNINILLLGKGGAAHDGPDLTDTMIVASVNPDKNTVNLISIPRDLWVPELNDKINSAYAIGQEKDNNGKFLAEKFIEKITGKQIDYVFVIDFSGFVKLVDHLGGVDVDVKNTLDDYAYPVEGKEDDPCDLTEEQIIDLSDRVATGAATELEAFPCRYKHIHFDKGIQHMTGEQALEFVRSRHGINGEGSDFARSQRQQLVIDSVRQKALSVGVLLNPVKVLGAFNIIKDNIDMNAQLSEIDDFVNLANKMQGSKITSTVIDIGEGERQGLLYHPPISEDQRLKWVLIPRAGDGDFSEIQEYVSCIEDGNICEVGEKGIIVKATTTPTGTKKNP